MRVWLIFALSFFLFAFMLPRIDWCRVLGGTSRDVAYSIVQSADGGFIVAGETSSDDFDVSGNHGGNDFWVVKLNGDGEILWARCFGGSRNESARDVCESPDGGVIVIGTTNSTDGNITNLHGMEDFWVVRLNNYGEILWQKCFGGSRPDYGYSVIPAGDGGYILCGNSLSNDGDISGHIGSTFWDDVWVVKIDWLGNIEWERSLGGTSGDEAFSIRNTFDGGYIIAGASYSSDGDLTGNFGRSDCWIVKLNYNGEIEWQRNLGGSDIDIAYDVAQTPDSGFILVGESKSNDILVSGNHGGYDFFVVRLNSSGTVLWTRAYGGSNADNAYSVAVVERGVYLIAGASTSADGDLSLHYGTPGEWSDFWLIAIDDSGRILWDSTFGGSNIDIPYKILPARGNSCVIAGETLSRDHDIPSTYGYGDFVVMKLSRITTINELNPIIPDKPDLFVYPNPFNSSVTISIASTNARVKLKIYNLLGEAVWESDNTKIEQSTKTGKSPEIRFRWTPDEKTPSGIYFLRSTICNSVITKRLLYIK